MDNIVLAAILAAILVLACVYIIKAKKSGKKCIGCPSVGSCNVSCSSCSGYSGCHK